MICEFNKCSRKATIKNSEYNPDKWLCTYHANRAKLQGRIIKKLLKLKKNE